MTGDEHDCGPRSDGARAVCDETAQLLATPDGIRLLRLLQATGSVQARAHGAAGARAASQRGRDVPIGVWEPRRDGDGLAFVRRAPPGEEEDWAPVPTLRPKQALLPIRVCLVGESAAAGHLYAPELTPARVLEAQLRAVRGAPAFEAVDLTRVDQNRAGLVAVTRAALQLLPDVLVVFAGNNWAAPVPDGPREAARRPLAQSHEDAEALAAGGAAALMRLSTRRLRDKAERTAAELARIAGEGGVPMVFVVPEVNLADWEYRQPPAWLPGDRTARWHRVEAEAARHVAAGAWRDVEAAARALVALDDGTCSTSHRILARALAMSGREDEAHAACRAELDASVWLGDLGRPGARSAVCEALRDAARAASLPCVDLAAVLREHTGSWLPGRRMFLDYCHLTAEGMHVAMTAVAAAVLELCGAADPAEIDWRRLLARVPAPAVAPAVEARACLLAALHNAHWMSAVGERADVVAWWIAQARRADGGIERVIADYAEASIAPCPSRLTAARARIDTTPYRMPARLWRWDDAVRLDAEVIRCSYDDVTDRLVAWRAVGDEGVELVRAGERAFERAAWPRSVFHFVSDGADDVTLDITARVASYGGGRGRSVGVLAEGAPVGRFEAGESWTRARVEVPRACLRRGVNRVELLWPELSAAGDAALAASVERLRLGLDPCLRPSFGDVFALRARVSR